MKITVRVGEDMRERRGVIKVIIKDIMSPGT